MGREEMKKNDVAPAVPNDCLSILLRARKWFFVMHYKCHCVKTEWRMDNETKEGEREREKELLVPPDILFSFSAPLKNGRSAVKANTRQTTRRWKYIGFCLQRGSMALDAAAATTEETQTHTLDIPIVLHRSICIAYASNNDKFLIQCIAFTAHVIR